MILSFPPQQPIQIKDLWGNELLELFDDRGRKWTFDGVFNMLKEKNKKDGKVKGTGPQPVKFYDKNGY